MLMPTKHIKTENALVGVGAELLLLLNEEKTVSRLFNDLQQKRKESELATISFDWFLLAAGFLFTIDAIRYESGLIKRVSK